MSIDYDALAVLRIHSMPIHKKLDQVGISTHLRNGTLDKKSYLKWLLVTYKFLTGYEIVMQKSNVTDQKIASYGPKNLCTTLLLNDIKELDANIDIPLPLSFPSILQKQLTLVPVYTLLGSLMGTQMIFNHVNNNHPSFPTSYLEGILKNKESWSEFKSEIGNLSMQIPKEELGNYTISFWEVVYEGYIQIFGAEL